MQNLTLSQFRSTQDAGGVLAVTLKAQGAGFEMQIETKVGPAMLVKSRDKTDVRRFLDPRKALLLLRELGIHEAHIDSQKWQPTPTPTEPEPRREGVAAVSVAYDANSYNDWLRKKLARSASDTRARVSHEQVMSDAQAIIDQKRHAKTAA